MGHREVRHHERFRPRHVPDPAAGGRGTAGGTRAAGSGRPAGARRPARSCRSAEAMTCCVPEERPVAGVAKRLGDAGRARRKTGGVHEDAVPVGLGPREDRGERGAGLARLRDVSRERDRVPRERGEVRGVGDPLGVGRQDAPVQGARRVEDDEAGRGRARRPGRGARVAARGSEREQGRQGRTADRPRGAHAARCRRAGRRSRRGPAGCTCWAFSSRSRAAV